jgi:KUP system potassium uptake protein
MRANVEHNRVRHDYVVILSIDTLPVPRVPDAERIEIDDLCYAGDGIVHAGARFGYMETPDVPRALRLLDPLRSEGVVDADRASYLLSKIELTKGAAPTMARRRKQLFIATSYRAADAAEYVGLPRDRSVIVGSRIEVSLVRDRCRRRDGQRARYRPAPRPPAPRG